MRKFMLLAAVAAVGMSPMLAHANDGSAAHKLEKMDSNKDGAVSKAEFDASKEQWFDTADANNDGSLTKEELEAAHKDKK